MTIINKNIMMNIIGPKLKEDTDLINPKFKFIFDSIHWWSLIYNEYRNGQGLTKGYKPLTIATFSVTHFETLQICENPHFSLMFSLQEELDIKKTAHASNKYHALP